MRSVEVRELRHDASALVQRVAFGESLVINDRGRPALGLGADLEGLVTYDDRMQEAAERLGLDTLAP